MGHLQSTILEENLVDEFILVQSAKEHESPVKADFDLAKFMKIAD